jgi:hypothetical protein
MSAAITPNVKGIVICDEAFARDVEADVYTLEGVRQQITATAFPHWQDLYLFIQLECARDGSFRGNVRFIHKATGKEARRAPLNVALVGGAAYYGVILPVPGCRFPAPGKYDGDVWFWDNQGREVQKGHREFDLIEESVP